MTSADDNETWVVGAGADVLRKLAEHGDEGLSAKEQLLYRLWVADYCMRNAGDLEQIDQMCEHCLEDAARLSLELALPSAHEAFSLPRPKFQAEYFSHFDRICSEVRRA